MSKIDRYEGSTRGERYQEAVIDLLEQILECVKPKEVIVEQTAQEVVEAKPKRTRKKE